MPHKGSNPIQYNSKDSRNHSNVYRASIIIPILFLCFVNFEGFEIINVFATFFFTGIFSIIINSLLLNKNPKDFLR